MSARGPQLARRPPPDKPEPAVGQLWAGPSGAPFTIETILSDIEPPAAAVWYLHRERHGRIRLSTLRRDPRYTPRPSDA